MGNEGRPIRVGDARPSGGSGADELLDPIALEERLKEARARRAAALAGRKRPAPPPRPDFAEAASGFIHADEAVPPPLAIEPLAVAAPAPVEPVEPVVGAPEPVPAPAAPVAVAPASPAAFGRLVRVPVWAIFAAGLALGAAVVMLVVLAPSAPQPSSVASVAPPAPVAETVAEPTEKSVASAPASPEPSTPAAVEASVTTVAPPEAEAVPDAPSPASSTAVPPLPDAGTLNTALGVPLPATELARPTVEPVTVPPDALESVRLAPEGAGPPEPPAAAPAATAAGPDTAAVRELAPRPRAARAPAQAPVAAPAGSAPLPARVTIHYPASAAAEAEQGRAALAAAGITDVSLLPVRLDISRSNVRFYHGADSAAASTVADLLAADGEAPTPRDFTDYRTPAAAGTVEVWLAGTSPGRSGPRTPAPPQETVASTVLGPAPTTLAPAEAPLVAPGPLSPGGAAPAGQPKTQAEAVARIIVERAYDRLLRAAPGN
jgi:hypothetical protein